MDDEHTKDYREPCEQCCMVDWGLTDEGKFFCRSCHNVIERTKEVDTEDVFTPSTRISSISRGLRKKKELERGRDWMVCEGFQVILKLQADALIAMGVRPEFKDEILWTFWRRYLQKSHQAYSNHLDRGVRSKIYTDSDSASESLHLSGLSGQSESETEDHLSTPRSPGSVVSVSVASVCSGSLDGGLYSIRKRREKTLMSMPMTLAFCYLSLLWLREPVTLAELLRLVAEGHIPYVNVYEVLPEEMKLFGQDAQLFRTETIPSYSVIKRDTNRIAVFLDLPCFPQITEDCLLHPNLLCIKYLMETNLPEELHTWVLRVIKHAGMGEVRFLTYDPLRRKGKLLNYDIQAAALIIVTLKLLFKLDDKLEWDLSNKADEENKKNKGHLTYAPPLSTRD
ncbi:TATA box-binding protein-associated factor RNA polymerase I subunit B isoform X2 [Amia ocellicauda]|uniref:TATA box-binding protein-associated factor RNA polymerase I subunit B isoform X2 n=1 Tax=Amia ocellicauda TaxID=2972642 RepID=UPI0034649506